VGGGSVSLYAKAQGFAHVTACDIAERGIVVGQALIENSRVRLTKEDVLRLARPDKSPPGSIESTLSPSTYTREQGRFLDQTLRIASGTADKAKAALFRLLAIRVALLAHPMSQVRPGTIHRLETGELEAITESCLNHYVDGMRLTRPAKLWELAQAINADVFQGRGTVLKRSVLDALPKIEAHVAYFDPPYPGVMSYEKEYRVIDQILEGQSRPTSPFTAKDGASMIDGLFERATHIPVWVLSLGNAVVSLEELEAKMLRHGRRTRTIEIAYQHLPAVATEVKKVANREFLVAGWDEHAVEELLRREQSDHATRVEFHDLSVSLVEKDASDGRPEAPALESLSNQALEEDQAGLTQDGATFQGEAVSKADRGDHPDAVRAHRALHLDRVRRVVAHGPTVPLLRRRVKSKE
jgi:hypothetical protein